MEFEDGFAAPKLFSQGYSYTYDDVIFLPHYIDFPTDAVSLSTRLTRRLPLHSPIVSSPMDTVTESSMAAAMASLGGLGFIHSNLPASLQAAMVNSVKSVRVPILSNPIFKSPSHRIDSLDDFDTSDFILVTESGSPTSKLLGYVSRSDWLNEKKEVKIYDYMVRSESSNDFVLGSGCDFQKIDSFFKESEKERERKFVALAREDDGEVVNVVTREEVERVRGYPKLGVGTVGPNGKWKVGAAVGTRQEDKERLEHLVKAGVDAVVLDSSQGNSLYQIEMIKYVKSVYPELDVVGGNVVTVAQAQNLIQAGVDGLRIGMGSGSICTTQEVCAVGRGQV